MTELVSLLQAHWMAISGGFFFLLTVAATVANVFRDPDGNPDTPPPKWVQIVDALAWLAPKGQTGFGSSRMSVPFKRSRRKSSSIAPALVLLLLPTFGACGFCRLPENAQTARCALERNLIACGQQTGFQLLPVVISTIVQAVAGHFDAGRLVGDLERLGFDNVPCVLASLEDYTLPENPQIASGMHDALKLALVRKGYHGDVGLKLKSGKIVRAIIP